MTDPNANRRAAAERVSAAFLSMELEGITSVKALKRYVERQRRTKIKITETSLLNGIDFCGIWGKNGDTDVIFHAETPSPLHRDQIVLHELAHMLLDHRPKAGDENNALVRRLFPHLNPDHYLLRAGLRTPEEQEAELLADLLAKRLRDNKKHRDNFEGVFG